MKENKKIMCLLFALLLIFQLTACSGEKEKCQNVLDEFEYACNELDADAMLRCINPKISDPIRLGLTLFTYVTEQDVENVIDEIGAVLIRSMDEINIDASELFQSMELEITKFKVKGSNAVAYVNIDFETLGIEMQKYGVFNLIKVDDTWYIESFAFMENSYE